MYDILVKEEYEIGRLRKVQHEQMKEIAKKKKNHGKRSRKDQ